LIDSSVQKAFIQGINGVIEHNQTFNELVSHAKSNQRTLHVTFFDLEDAFGSVHHDLISHSLTRLRFPTNITRYIENLYSNLDGRVITPDWESSRFRFHKGVFQGDPLSPIIFLAVFNPILEKLQQNEQFGYSLNGSKFITTPFADDFNLMTTNKRTHQRLLNEISVWTKSMNLKLKPVKCKSLSIVSGKPTPIEFSLGENNVSSIKDDPHKFLGSHLSFSGKQEDVFDHVKEHFCTRLERIDKLLVRGEFKVKIYKNYLLPSCRFILTVHDLTKTHLLALDSIVHKYIKSWSGLAHSAATEIFHIPHLLDIKSVYQLYLESHATAHLSSRAKADPKVNIALDSRLEREGNWTRKFSTINYCQNAVDQAQHSNPGASQKQLKTAVVKSIKEEVTETWYNHLKNLVVQGNMLLISLQEKSDYLWKSYIYNLPKGIMKFMLNSFVDTLPTKNNLSRWGKSCNSKCSLCGNKETLQHVLNNCKTMLDQGRYTWRHNSVLRKIMDALKDIKDQSWKIYCDLSGATKTAGTTIPPEILPTQQRPDLVLINAASSSIIIVELSVPFEANIHKAHEHKENRYASLVNDLREQGYDTDLFCVEIGSRGLISSSNKHAFNSIFSLVTNNKKPMKRVMNKFLKSISQCAMVCSYSIFYSKYDEDWCIS
jgi:hypothetical protein